MARGDGEGTIYKRKNGRWCGQVTVGTDPKTGKIIRKTFYGDKRRDVSRQMTELKQKLFEGSYKKQSEMKFGDWLLEWNKGRKNTVAYSTYRVYGSIIRNHLKTEIGDIKLKELETRHLQQVLNDRFDSGLNTGTVRLIYAIANKALKQAVKERLIYSNPSKGVELPTKQEEEKLHIWNKKQVSRFLARAKKHKYYMIFFLAVNTGMRRGELLGLKWKDIDFNKKRLEVKRQAVKTDKGIILKKPKSKAGNRVIPITNNVVKELKRHKIRQSENKLALGNNYKDQDLVNCNKLGEPISPMMAYIEFKNLSRDINLPEIKLHDLRHTFATLFLENGGNIKTLQQILGHSSITVTMDTYSHVTDEMLDSAAKNMDTMYKIKKASK
ncbi:site-specific recombinase XerD [Halanaerobium saccharolyticum]|jgi:integrase|uniref:Site-specific recombinase XerD n=1 Tax=Halanaerobium saccharolyticum TaxID=43595 RepID=A0A2T5RJ92_9FIRM|nr:site-specific integrase [Halanaerobium saccharolyticum]PTV98618.1 site-specific recombinase XerD [Halanaerobium saccharolyticum]